MHQQTITATCVPEEPRAKASLSYSVLVVTNHYDPEPTGSAPPVTDYCRWLADRNHHVTVVTPRPSYPGRQVFPGYEAGQRDRETLDGVHVHRLPSMIPRSGGLIQRLLAELSFAMQLGRAIRKLHLEPDVKTIVFCPSILSVRATAQAMTKTCTPPVAVVHDIQSGLARSLGFPGASLGARLLERIEIASLNRCRAIITLSEEMGLELRRMGVRTHISISPPQLDLGEFTKSEQRPLDKVVCYSGNFGRKQGMSQLMDFCEEMSLCVPGATVLLRGAGSELDSIRREVAVRHLSNVVLEGLVDRASLPKKMKEAVIHLVPQDPRAVAFSVPSKVFTIMASGRPFIGTASAGSPLAVLAAVSGAGICVEPHDPTALVMAVEELLKDPLRCARMGQAGVEYVRQFVDRDVVCGQMSKMVFES